MFGWGQMPETPSDEAARRRMRSEPRIGRCAHGHCSKSLDSGSMTSKINMFDALCSLGQEAGSERLVSAGAS